MNSIANDEQHTLWNGAAGHAWVEAQALLDRILKPFEDLIADAVPDGSASHVLDVGCGSGTTTLALARRLGANGDALGIDISAPMLALARTRAAEAGLGARFVHADAQTYTFETGRFDTIVSRFGVMFFDEPVRAFSNLRQAAKPAARLRVVAWRSAAENAFMTAAERAAGPLLPEFPARRPDGPGQFAFADPAKVQAILRDGEWRDVELQPLDIVCRFPASELTYYATRLGPVGIALQKADSETRSRVTPVAQAAFDSYVHGDEVRFTAACWLLSAVA
jgi:SAM-dependent methyltransferase